MVENSGDSKKPLPPYIAFKTLIDIVERMERDDMPARVDPSYLDSYAGGYRPTVISNLQTLGLLASGGEPTERCEALVYANEADRKHLIGEIIKEVYSEVFALGLNTTQSQFLEVFTIMGVRGDTRRKAVSFFMKACAFSGVPVGKMWKTPPAAAPGVRRKPQPAGPKDSDGAPAELPTVQHAGTVETVKVDLGTAGNVTVHVDVKWLDLPDSHVKTIRDAIKSLKSMEKTETPESNSNSDSDDDDDETEGDDL